MTTFDRFDPFERRIGEALDGIAPTRQLDYLDDVFRQTARTAQRPRWSFPERWLKVDTTLARPMLFGRKVPLQSIAILVALALLVAVATAVYVGSQPRVQPFGPAGNGALAYTNDGDIYVRGGLTGEPRLLVGGPGTQFAPSYSPDGTRLAYVSTAAGGDHFLIANADGTGAREIALIPPTGNAQAEWSPDSRHMALIYDVGGIPTLSIADADGSSRVIDFGSKWPLHAIWSPPTGERLLVHAQGEIGSAVDLYTVRADGSDLTAFGLPGESTWGPWYTLSGAVWAPDGATIAYNSLVEDPATQVTTFNVELVAADGSNPRALPGPADPLVNEGWPSYSPDGKWIVVQHWTFSSESDEGYNTLAIMPADGSAPAREFGPRFPGGERADIATTWSPDGTSIIVDPLAAPTYEVRQFFLVDLVTGDSEEIPWAQEAIAWQRVQLR